ncbi:MAG: hypothetical protein EBR09_13175, partial [Proteobacteria bacterium]|nr:hypothetical protein [Pseudomonadota bacterium]
ARELELDDVSEGEERGDGLLAAPVERVVARGEDGARARAEGRRRQREVFVRGLRRGLRGAHLRGRRFLIWGRAHFCLLFLFFCIFAFLYVIIVCLVLYIFVFYAAAFLVKRGQK